MRHLCTVLELVYSTTPDNDRGLRDIAIENCSKSINQSFLGDFLLSNQKFEAIVRNDGTLAFDVLVRIHRAKRLVDKEKVQLKQAVHDWEKRLRRANETIEGLRREVKSANTAAREQDQLARDAEARAVLAREELQVLRAEGSIIRQHEQAGSGVRPVSQSDFFQLVWVMGKCWGFVILVYAILFVVWIIDSAIEERNAV